MLRYVSVAVVLWGWLPPQSALPLGGGVLSFKAQQWALEQDDVRFPDKFVLFMLAYRDNHDEPHGCYPSLNRMAKDCGLSRRTVIRSIKRLVKSGKVKSERRHKVNGDPSSNYYSFPTVWEGSVTQSPPPSKVVSRRHRGSALRSPRVVSDSHPNLLDGTIEEPSRSAQPLPPEENKKFQEKFLAEMKKMSGSKSL